MLNPAKYFLFGTDMIRNIFQVLSLFLAPIPPPPKKLNLY